MKDVACTWRTTFTPIVTGDVEQETGFDDPEQVYLAHRAKIEEGVQVLAEFIRAQSQIEERTEYVLTHGCQGRPNGGGMISGCDFIDVLRGFLTLILMSSTVLFARRQVHGDVGDEVVLEVRIFNGLYGDFHLQARQQCESGVLENTQSLDFLPSRYPEDKRIGKSLRMRLTLGQERICAVPGVATSAA